MSPKQATAVRVSPTPGEVVDGLVGKKYPHMAEGAIGQRAARVPLATNPGGLKAQVEEAFGDDIADGRWDGHRFVYRGSIVVDIDAVPPQVQHLGAGGNVTSYVTCAWEESLYRAIRLACLGR